MQVLTRLKLAFLLLSCSFLTSQDIEIPVVFFLQFRTSCDDSFGILRSLKADITLSISLHNVHILHCGYLRQGVLQTQTQFIEIYRNVEIYILLESLSTLSFQSLKKRKKRKSHQCYYYASCHNTVPSHFFC